MRLQTRQFGGHVIALVTLVWTFARMYEHVLLELESAAKAFATFVAHAAEWLWCSIGFVQAHVFLHEPDALQRLTANGALDAAGNVSLDVPSQSS